MRERATVVVSRRGRVDDGVGLNAVDLKGVPRSAPLETDEPAWWTLED